MAGADEVWSAVRDIGALHTRFVPGFVTDTYLESGARIVTFGNGMVLREPIIAINDDVRRLVWSAKGGPYTHYKRRFKFSLKRRALHAWFGLLISYQTRSPALRTPRWRVPCKS